MMFKKIKSVRNYKAGYVVTKGIVDGGEWGCDDFEASNATTPEGFNIGDPKTAHYLCKKIGIKPQYRTENSNICSIGFCESEQKWFGWSHRAICGFGIGDVVKEGDCTASSGFTEEYLKDHPEADTSLPVGFTAKSLDDAKRMAEAFADSVS